MQFIKDNGPYIGAFFVGMALGLMGQLLVSWYEADLYNTYCRPKVPLTVLDAQFGRVPNGCEVSK